MLVCDDRQQTVARDVLFEGVGLHTGRCVTLTVKSAPANKGFVFIRKDLEGQPEVAVDVSCVKDTLRGTTISKEGVVIHTVEHLMAALLGVGIDNALLELTADEVPILDGSSILFCQNFLKAGLVKQDKTRQYFNLSQSVTLNQPDMFLVALPCDSLRISFTIEYEHPYLKHQSMSYDYSSETFVKDIASARTFCFDYEIEALRRDNLIKGGNLDNAIVITETGVLNEPMRFKDEFIRHKILDIIGDMSLLGQRLNAHIVAHKSGHALNIGLVKALAKMLNRRCYG